MNLTPTKKPSSDGSGSGRKIANSLVALSSAAVLTVYTAGYLRTRSAAERFAVHATQRRPAVPAPALVVTPAAPPPGARPAVSAPPAPESVAGVSPSRTVLPPPSPTSTTIPDTAPAPAAIEGSTPQLSAAPAAIPTAEPAAAPAVAEQVEYKDGTYFGMGESRHGDIHISVLIEGGRITRAEVTECYTNFPCTPLEVLYPQVVARQSANVDYVSGATESSVAFYDALVMALARAK